MNIKEKVGKHPVAYFIGLLATAIVLIETIRSAIFPVSIGYYKDKYNDCELENAARRDSIRTLIESVSALNTFLENPEVEEYDTLIALYGLVVGDSIMPFNNLSKIKIMKVALDEFKNQDTVGLIINFVFYADSQFVDAEYDDSIYSGYSMYNQMLTKNETFQFNLASGNRYKCKLTDISSSDGKTVGALEFYQIQRRKKGK